MQMGIIIINALRMILMNLQTKPTTPKVQAIETDCKPAAPKTIDSHQLFGMARECWITHAGQTYRLCHTRNDKLILIK
jgi:hemin uptake protein HemP